MDPDPKEMGDLQLEDADLIDRGELSRLIDMEFPLIGLQSKASFEQLMRALDARRVRQHRRRLLLAGSLGAATVIAGVIATLRLLSH